MYYELSDSYIAIAVQYILEWPHVDDCTKTYYVTGRNGYGEVHMQY